MSYPFSSVYQIVPRKPTKNIGHDTQKVPVMAWEIRPSADPTATAENHDPSMRRRYRADRTMGHPPIGRLTPEISR